MKIDTGKDLIVSSLYKISVLIKVKSVLSKHIKISKFHKEKEVLRQVAKASQAIRRKHRMLKMGKEAIEQMMSETFKPIVIPL